MFNYFTPDNIRVAPSTISFTVPIVTLDSITKAAQKEGPVKSEKAVDEEHVATIQALTAMVEQEERVADRWSAEMQQCTELRNTLQAQLDTMESDRKEDGGKEEMITELQRAVDKLTVDGDKAQAAWGETGAKLKQSQDELGLCESKQIDYQSQVSALESTQKQLDATVSALKTARQRLQSQSDDLRDSQTQLGQCQNQRKIAIEQKTNKSATLSTRTDASLALEDCSQSLADMEELVVKQRTDNKHHQTVFQDLKHKLLKVHGTSHAGDESRSAQTALLQTFDRLSPDEKKAQYYKLTEDEQSEVAKAAWLGSSHTDDVHTVREIQGIPFSFFNTLSMAEKTKIFYSFPFAQQSQFALATLKDMPVADKMAIMDKLHVDDLEEGFGLDSEDDLI